MLEAAHASLLELLAPPSVEEVAAAIGAMAGMFNVPVPEKQGLALYTLAFSGIPRQAFKLGCREVLSTHRWPRLPYPAEIADGARVHADILRIWERRVTIALSYLT